MADKPGDGRRPPHAQSKEEIEKRRRAEGMARAAFGRFYWNDRLERELRQSLQEAMKRKRKAKT